MFCSSLTNSSVKNAVNYTVVMKLGQKKIGIQNFKSKTYNIWLQPKYLMTCTQSIAYLSSNP